MSEEKRDSDPLRLSASSFRAHVDTRALAEFIKDVPDGEVITYEAIKDFIGYSVRRGTGYQRLYTARGIVEREYGKVFMPEYGEGLRCLTDADKTVLPDRTIKKVRRSVRKTKKRISTIKEYSALTSEEKRRLNTSVVQLMMIEDASSRKKRNAIESDVPNVDRHPMAGVFETLRSKKKDT